MPQFQNNWAACTANPYIAEQLSYDQEREGQEALANIAQLNAEQHDAFTRVFDAVEKQNPKIFFLNGPGGTGKTFVYKTVCHKVRSMGWIVLCVASSGIAALLLKGGHTAHSVFKIPI
ncbi:hypothetical protein PISMIDRAFT_99675, partial [Pisolithus microcarpus 441]